MCRPPSNDVVRNVLTIRYASDSEMNHPGKVRILASLCALDKRLISSFQHKAALIPGCLFTTMFIPLPVPHMDIPNSYSPAEIAFASG